MSLSQETPSPSAPWFLDSDSSSLLGPGPIWSQGLKAYKDLPVYSLPAPYHNSHLTQAEGQALDSLAQHSLNLWLQGQHLTSSDGLTGEHGSRSLVGVAYTS